MITALITFAFQTVTAELPLPPLHWGSNELTCPVGGERFSAAAAFTYSIMGRRPDGKPYSEIPFPTPMPTCPDNGLVIFANFTPPETLELGKWIATPTYQRMRTTESPYYRAYWLAKKIGWPDADAIELLLPAIWSAKDEDGGDPRRPRTLRYQRALVSAVQAVSPDASVDDRKWLEGQAANALREMGKFAAAERMLAHAKSVAGTSNRPSLAIYLQSLKVVIARRDRSDEPLDMIPEAQAAVVCRDKPPAGAFARSYCAKPEISKVFGT